MKMTVISSFRPPNLWINGSNFTFSTEVTSSTTTTFNDYFADVTFKIDYDTGGGFYIKAANPYSLTSSDSTSYWNYDWEAVVVPPKDRLREIIRKRQSPIIINSRKHIQHTQDLREIRARETLKLVIGDEKYRNFLRNGFVSAKAKSGKIYQMFPGHDMTTVYLDGKKIEKLCVVFKGNFPPTDSLIMRYLLILNDEEDFRKHAIRHTVYPASIQEVDVDNRSLPEIYRGMVA